MPPEMGLGLVQAMKSFSERCRAKTELDWAFAGLSGDGAIVNVDSHEELDQMLSEFPFGPFSEMKFMAKRSSPPAWTIWPARLRWRCRALPDDGGAALKGGRPVTPPRTSRPPGR